LKTSNILGESGAVAKVIAEKHCCSRSAAMLVAATDPLNRKTKIRVGGGLGIDKRL
jgi:hypothetical protein